METQLQNSANCLTHSARRGDLGGWFPQANPGHRLIAPKGSHITDILRNTDGGDRRYQTVPPACAILTTQPLFLPPPWWVDLTQLRSTAVTCHKGNSINDTHFFAEPTPLFKVPGSVGDKNLNLNLHWPYPVSQNNFCGTSFFFQINKNYSRTKRLLGPLQFAQPNNSTDNISGALRRFQWQLIHRLHYRFNL